MAIFGIMTMIALPSYKSYQAKAIQKEGFNLLSSYYIEAKNRRTEYHRYPGNLIGTDFSPKGELVYRFRAENNPDAQIHNDLATANIDNDPTCIATWGNCDCGGACVSYRKEWVEKPVGIIGSRIGPQTVRVACPPLAPLGVDDDRFSVRVAAVINTESLFIDRYGINDQKEMIACEDGLK